VDHSALRSTLEQLSAGARDDLRHVLIREQPVRDAIAQRLLRRRTERADQLAELIDMLTIDDEMRRRVVRTLGEMEATARS
jgi:hypothetical protein